MDGNALAQSVKKDPKLKDLPIIMVTASKEVDLVKKSFSSGVVLFLLETESNQPRYTPLSEAAPIRTSLPEANNSFSKLRGLVAPA